jgi:hypothetical protein
MPRSISGAVLDFIDMDRVLSEFEAGKLSRQAPLPPIEEDDEDVISALREMLDAEEGHDGKLTLANVADEIRYGLSAGKCLELTLLYHTDSLDRSGYGGYSIGDYREIDPVILRFLMGPMDSGKLASIRKASESFPPDAFFMNPVTCDVATLADMFAGKEFSYCTTYGIAGMRDDADYCKAVMDLDLPVPYGVDGYLHFYACDDDEAAVQVAFESIARFEDAFSMSVVPCTASLTLIGKHDWSDRKRIGSIRLGYSDASGVCDDMLEEHTPAVIGFN